MYETLRTSTRFDGSAFSTGLSTFFALSFFGLWNLIFGASASNFLLRFDR